MIFLNDYLKIKKKENRLNFKRLQVMDMIDVHMDFILNSKTKKVEIFYENAAE